MREHSLFIDNFCGGGGASTGIAAALGRSVDIAVNHDPLAIAIHSANHDVTEHHCQDIRAVWPAAVTRLREVAGIWFSPDCKEFSKAKGGPVKDRNIRALADEIVVWLRETRPTVAYVENVEEFEYAAPLDARGVPIPDQKGRHFKRLVRSWRAEGYKVAWRLLRACDYGAPTSRRRLYIIMRCDGAPIVWPKPTHAAPADKRVIAGKLEPYRTAAECIDWSLPCPSIFDRQRELVDATKRRVAHGVMRYVLNNPRPFIVPVTHGGDLRVHDSLEPLRTVTTANGGEFMAADVTLAPHITKFHSGSVGAAMSDPVPTVTSNGNAARPAGATPLGLVGATLIQTGHGERAGQAPRALDPSKPLGTIVATAENFAAVSAFLSPFYSNNRTAGSGAADQPLGTVTAGGNHHPVVVAHMEQANTGRVGHAMTKPISTITTQGSHQRLVETTLLPEDALPEEMMAKANQVAAFLVKFYGTGVARPIDAPIDTLTTLNRYAVVTVEIDAVTYVIVDIGLRMLTPRELARAQGFPETYVLDPEVEEIVRGKLVRRRMTKAAQIRMIGNSVCPDVARALVAANQPGANDNYAGTMRDWKMAA